MENLDGRTTTSSACVCSPASSDPLLRDPDPAPDPKRKEEEDKENKMNIDCSVRTRHLHLLPIVRLIN